MSKFLDDLECNYEQTYFKFVKPDEVFTIKRHSVVGFTKTNKSWKEEIFPGGRWASGPMGTITSDENASYNPPVYATRGTSVSLVNMEEVVFDSNDIVYRVKHPIFFTNKKTNLAVKVTGSLSELLRKDSIFIRRGDGVYRCDKCGNNVGRNFNYCPWCGKRKALLLEDSNE